MQFCAPLLLRLALLQGALTIAWLRLQHEGRWDGRARCGAVFSAGTTQARACRALPEAMPHVAQAAALTAAACQQLMASRRWNCSSIRRAPDYTAELSRGTREQAFVYALSAAALAHTMAKACASGALPHCTCLAPAPADDEGAPADFKWGGCGDNVLWAGKFARRFLGLTKRARRTAKEDRLQEAVNRDNSQAGIKVVEHSLDIQCKCHGVSGSCNIKTCWRALPSLADVGGDLVQSYTAAEEVAAMVVKRRGRKAKRRDHHHHKKSTRLAFTARSPDYCTRDDKLGSLGTKDRLCNATSLASDNCRYMCCGRGHRTILTERLERCQCKYYWCCYVQCKTCKTTLHTFICN